MAAAKKPSIELRDKENINPSLLRKNEAVDLDFHNIYEVLFDHAEKIDGFTGGNTGNVFYGFHSSIEILSGAYPDVAEDSFAIIEGATPQIAQFNNGEWINTGGKAPFVFVNNKFQRPNPGTEGTWYIVKDSNTAWLWYDGKYHVFIMTDLSNYYTKDEIDTEIADIITAADNLADTVAEAELDVIDLKSRMEGAETAITNLKANAKTGSDINLGNVLGNNYNYGSASSSLAYTTNNPVINGYAPCLINASSEPVVYETDGETPATKIKGVDFAANTTMELVIESKDGINVRYFFLAL